MYLTRKRSPIHIYNVLSDSSSACPMTSVLLFIDPHKPQGGADKSPDNVSDISVSRNMKSQVVKLFKKKKKKNQRGRFATKQREKESGVAQLFGGFACRT